MQLICLLYVQLAVLHLMYGYAVCDPVVHWMHQCNITSRLSEEHTEGVLHYYCCDMGTQSYH